MIPRFPPDLLPSPFLLNQMRHFSSKNRIFSFFERFTQENLIDFDAELGDRICDIPEANMKKLLAFEAESNPAIRRGQSATVLFSDPITVIKVKVNLILK